METLLFHDLKAVEAYDGVWANACLLHVPRPELAHVLGLIWRALKPAGYFYASYKTGAADGRDKLNRYYNYPSPDWLRATYSQAGPWSSLSVDTGEVKGFDNEQAAMLFVVARKKPLTLCSQTTLKIASASTACARKPTVKASVRNTGRPSV